MVYVVLLPYVMMSKKWPDGCYCQLSIRDIQIQVSHDETVQNSLFTVGISFLMKHYCCIKTCDIAAVQ